jgi:hypothetical protein
MAIKIWYVLFYILGTDWISRKKSPELIDLCDFVRVVIAWSTVDFRSEQSRSRVDRGAPKKVMRVAR